MFPLLLVATVDIAHAHSGGQTGRSAVGCSCHGAATDPTTTAAFGAAPAVVLPGTVVPLTFTVTTTNAARESAGLDVSVTGGTLSAGSGGTTRLSNGEITHVAPQGEVAGVVTFGFDWTAPAAEGLYDLRGAGNATNGNGNASGDGWDLATTLVIEVDDGCDDTDGDGIETCEGDCDDTDDTVFPGADEVCDGVDNDCSGEIDDDALDGTLFHPDADLDGFGSDDREIRACSPPFQHLATRGDCDDDNAAVNPDAVEICDAGNVDQDCNGTADDALATGTIAWFVDADGDGFGAGAAIVACDAPTGRIAVDGDCNDADAGINPGIVEDCLDPLDRNCDGAAGLVDNDNDGYAACVECDDGDSSAFPGASERCDGDDDDCDGATDESDAIDTLVWYEDADIDGHGNPAVLAEGCTAPAGFVASAADCDDDDATVSPDAAEVWYDGIDQTCDGNDDDQDGDGVPAPTDCIDTDPAVLPGATDLPYDGLDADCAGDDDFDADDDGHPASPPDGSGDDCDDADPAVHPGTNDPPCDGIDLDCDPGPDDAPDCIEETGDTGAPPITDDRPPADPDPEVAIDEGCGCDSSGAAGFVFLPLFALLGRRRPWTWGGKLPPS